MRDDMKKVTDLFITELSGGGRIAQVVREAYPDHGRSEVVLRSQKQSGQSQWMMVDVKFVRIETYCRSSKELKASPSSMGLR
jgi:predicted RNA-binding protein with PUA-like domain